jgi:class 3 adenylate cyclase
LIGVLARDLDRDQRGLGDLLVGIPAVGEDPLDEREDAPTAMSTRMDAEDLRYVISAYQKCIAETMRCFDGFVAKYMGDGVLIYFGYPQAHEDDAERAVRAGLEIVAITALKSSVPLQTRIGIATGVVVVGAT